MPATVALLLAASVWMAAVQEAPPPAVRSAFEFQVGFVAGGPLWAVDRQPLVVAATADFISPRTDTLVLDRKLDPGFALGVGFLWYPTGLLGVRLGALYLMPQIGTVCRMYYEDLTVDTTHANADACVSAAANAPAGSTLLVDGQAVLRLAPHGAIVPAVRLGGGLSVQQYDPVGVAGITRGGLRTIYRDQVGVRIRPALTAALSLAVAASLQWQMAFEAGMMLTPVVGVAGPMPLNAEGTPPTAERWMRQVHVGFVLGMVLDHRRGRRY